MVFSYKSVTFLYLATALGYAAFRLGQIYDLLFLSKLSFMSSKCWHQLLVELQSPVLAQFWLESSCEENLVALFFSPEELALLCPLGLYQKSYFFSPPVVNAVFSAIFCLWPLSACRLDSIFPASPRCHALLCRCFRKFKTMVLQVCC